MRTRPDSVTVLTRRFKVSRTGAIVTKLRLRAVSRGARVTVRCKGKGCAFKQKRVKLRKAGAALEKLFKRRRLRKGTRITITSARKGMTGRTYTLTVRKKGQPKLKRS